jgi:glycosyltransferase involved in cell wall biosynthesis
MSDVVIRLSIEEALARRLRAVAPLLLDVDAPRPDPDPTRDAGNMLDLLVRAVTDVPTPARTWLLCTAVSGSLPKPDDVVMGARFFRFAPVIDATLWILDYALETAGTRVAHQELRVVTGGVLVDVDHTARHDLHTGIQQVVRQVLPLWMREHDILPVMWTEPAQAMRSLVPSELSRARSRGLDATEVEQPRDDHEPILVVPWQSVVVLPEVPFPDACDRLAALAQFSGNDVVAIGYDCIPALSADMMPPGETNRFARYLTVIKHAQRVASIGETSTLEFRGFTHALSAQGLTGPLVSEVALPVGGPTTDTAGYPGVTDGTPLILSVGSFEPRKNHLALLYAAERLWRDGLEFELLMIGGSGWGDAVPQAVARLKNQGRPVRTVSKATSADLSAAYERAAFTVFASFHEGFGLPVAESLEHGTPVITTNYGSTREIASGGGAILVDPRDDEELVSAMRQLLTDDDLLRQLRRAIRARPTRTWEDYATELWDGLVAPSLDRSPSAESRPT